MKVVNDKTHRKERKEELVGPGGNNGGFERVGLILRGGIADGTEAAEGDFLLRNRHALRQIPDLLRGHGGVEGDVRDGAAVRAEKVRMLLQVCAIARGLPLMIDGANQSGRRECFQTIITRCQRDGRHAVFDPHEDLDGAGVVGPRHQGVENSLALFSLTDAFLRKGIRLS